MTTTFSREEALRAMWSWITAGGTTDPATTAPLLTGMSAYTTLINAAQSPLASTGWGAPQVNGAYFLNTVRAADGTDGRSIEWDVNVAGGTFTIDVMGFKNGDAPKIDVQIDGVVVGTVDQYAAAGVAAVQSLTGIAVTNGRHRLKLVVNGKNASSSSFAGRLSGIGLTRTAA